MQYILQASVDKNGGNNGNKGHGRNEKSTVSFKT